MKRLVICTLLLGLISVCVNCKGDDPQHNNDKPKVIIPAKLTSPFNDTEYDLGDIVSFKIEVNDASKIKEMSLYIDDTLYEDNLKLETQTIDVDTKEGKTGWVDVYLAYTDSDGKPHRDNRGLLFFSNTIPEQKTAKIVESYTHSKSSYTQGLEFYNGRMYESTGQKGASLLAEVDFTSGSQLRSKDLETAYFGEGITILNDTIYQLTWKSGLCFMYDMAFNKIGEFNYEGEGWGLRNNGKSLIMTNGSEGIVWRNPRTFEIEKTIYAFKPEESVTGLNELELINGDLYINVYTKNTVVVVDTTSGKVKSNIDCLTLEDEGRVVGSDVLNGIAHNPITGKTYMTGKYWPLLFEVVFED